MDDVIKVMVVKYITCRQNAWAENSKNIKKKTISELGKE